MIEVCTKHQHFKKMIALLKKNEHLIEEIRFETHWTIPVHFMEKRQLTGHSVVVNLKPNLKGLKNE